MDFALPQSDALKQRRISHMARLLCHLNKDILADIIGRLDASSLASASCTCSALLDVARDQSLWRHLCFSTWPSISFIASHSQQLFSSSPVDDFRKFYADSSSLLLYDKHADEYSKPMCPVSPSGFISLVDVYYKNECILSKVLDGIPEAMYAFKDKDMDSDRETNTNCYQKWLLNSAFKLDLLDSNHINGYDDIIHDDRLDLLTTSLDGKLREDSSNELERHLRLSWVMLDKKKGKVVNLSSWKPLLVQSIWPYIGNYAVHFGSIVPVVESLLPHKLGKCVIIARCKLTNRGQLKWTQISMHIEDITGAHVSVRKSLIVLNQALYSLRSKNCLEVEKGYCLFEQKKRDMKKRKEFQETLADWLCTLLQVTVLVVCCYSFVSSLLRS